MSIGREDKDKDVWKISRDVFNGARGHFTALPLVHDPPRTAAKTAAGTLGMPFNMQTNIFCVNLEEPSTVWKYEIRIYAKIRGKTVFFTKKCRNDFLVANRSYKCNLIFGAVVRKYNNFFGHPSMSWYDGQGVLFSRVNLFKDVNKTRRSFRISGEDCREETLLAFKSITLVVAPAEENIGLSINMEEMMNYARRLDLSEEYHSLVQYMDIVFNQLALMNPRKHVSFESGKTFLCCPWMYGFNEKDCPNVGDGKRLLPGTQKSICFIEGTRGRGFVSAALAIDAKKAAFHEEMRLIDKAKIIVNDNLSTKLSEIALEKLDLGLKGLFFYTKHTGHKVDHQIESITGKTASEATFKFKGVKVSVLQYFKEQYKISLEYPNAPLVKVREGSRVNSYPMELGFIREMQRVTIFQQTPSQSDKMKKNCVVPPGERQGNIKRGAYALKLFGSRGNSFVTNAGFHILRNPMKIRGRRLLSPKISYSDCTIVVRNGKWSTPETHFYKPASCEVWAMYAIVPANEREGFSECLLWDFEEIFLYEASHRGMKLRSPIERTVTSNEAELEECFKCAADNQCSYCLIISSDSAISVHKKIKLWERELEIVTQEVKLSTVIKVVKENQRQILENIVLKTNVKLGGLNYELDLHGMAASEDGQGWIREGRVFLGISVNHSSLLCDYLSPVVFGYASNFKKNSIDFVGDYLFQNYGKEETLATLCEIVIDVFYKFLQHHDDRVPKDLIIYRSGISERSFKTVLTYDIPQIRRKLSEHGVQDIKLVFIVVQKNHNIRFMRPLIDQSRELFSQNIPPGVVVDSNVTHPAFKEFYLNSHFTFQGSAVTPRYTVLVDDLNLSMDELEGMTHVLTYAHQIVNLSTSLPAPLYVANRYAERGRSIHEAYVDGSSTRSSVSEGSIDYIDSARYLTYKSTKLEKIRVNA